MARRALWEVGLNYNHGTGHGVGAYLNVHEYPPLISSRNSATGMCKNMFTTNEPGYYEDIKFGVRIENVLQVVDLPDSVVYQFNFSITMMVTAIVILVKTFRRKRSP